MLTITVATLLRRVAAPRQHPVETAVATVRHTAGADLLALAALDLQQLHPIGKARLPQTSSPRRGPQLLPPSETTKEAARLAGLALLTLRVLRRRPRHT